MVRLFLEKHWALNMVLLIGVQAEIEIVKKKQTCSVYANLGRISQKNKENSLSKSKPIKYTLFKFLVLNFQSKKKRQTSRRMALVFRENPAYQRL